VRALHSGGINAPLTSIAAPPPLSERRHRRLARRLINQYTAHKHFKGLIVRRTVLAVAVLCLGLFGLWYGFASTSEALKVIFVGTGLVLTSIGVTWLAVELFVV
jgi:hypothetical protein